MRHDLIILACIVVASAPSHGAVTHNGLWQNGLWQNRLSTNRLATNRLATNRLATNRLATNRLAINGLGGAVVDAGPAATELLSTPERRELYGYIVGCALPAGVTIAATVDGTRFEFPGAVGLAPRWLGHRLTRSGRGWISACLLARVNAHGLVETISMRGRNPALALGPGELSEFSLQEGSFYGDVFARVSGPANWNACRGRDQAAGETGELVNRDCAEPDASDPTHTQWGFSYAGDCADYTPAFPSSHACSTVDPDSGAYGSCHATPAPGKSPRAKTYREVITTFVRP